MKLSLKIFLSICISAVVLSLLVLGITLDKNYKINIQNENERSIEEFHIIKSNMKTNMLENTNILPEEIIKIYNYYSNNGMYFTYLNNNQIIYSSLPELNEYITQDLLENEKDTYISKVVKLEDKHYMLISSSLNEENQKLIYIREITEIYKIQEEMKQYGYMIITISIVVIAILSYAISKSLTIPLDNIKKEQKKLLRVIMK